VSIGIAISKNQLDSVSVLLQHGDFAMYEAKKFGRDCCVVYEEGQRTPLVARASLEQDLRSALERGQMMIYYQPVVDSDTGLKVSCEALLRWACPGRGLVSPGEFIPILEESGMILPFGRWVLQRACEQLGRWQVDFQRFDLTVSVNLSPRQLNDPELIPSIEHALASSGVAPSSLNVEITETMIVDDLERAKSTLEAIGNLGVDLLIDDFGTGYSSLSYLKRLPVACIKIDRSFISNICEDPADQAIVAAVSELARRLNVYTVAEGVETAEQLTLVRSLGCTLIQGFYYSPALPAREFAASWLASLDHSYPELVALGSTQRPSPTANMHGAECPIRAEEQV
jgi:EAL domain-containing protein (putative c-di-GMP-specific phosphodiesterase class I)